MQSSATETFTNQKFVYSAVKQIEENHATDGAKPLQDNSKPSYRNEYIAAFGVFLSMFYSGLSFTWPATSIPLLMDHDSPIQVENHHLPIIVSCLQLGMLPGAIAGCLFADYIGRQRVVLWTAIPFLISSLTFGFSTNVNYLFMARFMAGIGLGASFTVIPVYISEISTPAIRGKLSASVVGMGNAVGILYMYIVSPYLTIRRNALFCAFVPVLMFGIMYMNPESPYFLMMKNREADARKALVKLRNRSDIEEELIRIRKGVKEQQAQKASPLELVRGSNLKAFWMITFSFFLQQFCGVTIFVSYSQTLMAATHTGLPIDFCGMMIPVISIAVVSLSAKLSDKSGRVQLLRISCFGTALINFLVGSFFFIQEGGSSYIDSLSYIPVLCIVCFKSTYFFGLGNVPYLIMVELMPTNVRAWSTCVFTLMIAFLSMVSLFCYELLKLNFGMSFAFMAFAFLSAGGGALVGCILLETKGQTLEQIQDKLQMTRNETVLKL